MQCDSGKRPSPSFRTNALLAHCGSPFRRLELKHVASAIVSLCEPLSVTGDIVPDPTLFLAVVLTETSRCTLVSMTV